MSTDILQDISRFPDCSALSLKGRCTRLSLPVCQGEGCTFKRNSKEDNNSLQHVYQRLSSLDLSVQIQIAKKYYGGLMPWSEAKTVRKLKVYERLTATQNKIED
jgi:hypothetical protein